MDSSPIALEPTPPIAAKRRRWYWAAAALPALVPLWLILKYNVNTIWNDAWDLAEILMHAHAHTLTWSDFWAPHNEHHMPVPYLIMLILARLTHWNTTVEALTGYAMVVLLAILLAKLLIRTTSRGAAPSIWIWFVMMTLIFSPMQQENWILGFDACQNFIPFPCLVGAILLLQQQKLGWRAVLGAGFLVELAALSLANALLGWAILFPLLWVTSARQELWRRKQFITCWIVMAAGSFVAQFWGYKTSYFAGMYYYADPGTRVEYFLAFLGTPLCFGVSHNLEVACVLGVVLVTCFGVCAIWVFRLFLRGKTDRVLAALPWLGIASYALGSAILGAAGRAGIGADQALASRYTTIAICLPIGLLGMLSNQAAAAGRFTFGRLLGGTILVGTIVGGICAIPICIENSASRRASQAHLTFINLINGPSTAKAVSGRPNLPELANAMNALGYIHPPLAKDRDISALIAPAPARPFGVIEERRTWHETEELRGSAILPDKHRSADLVLLTFQNTNGEELLCGIADVSHTRADPAPNATWIGAIPHGRLPSASVSIRAWAYDVEQQRAYPLTDLSGSESAPTTQAASKPN